jgi:hypothetical protein
VSKPQQGVDINVWLRHMLILADTTLTALKDDTTASINDARETLTKLASAAESTTSGGMKSTLTAYEGMVTTRITIAKSWLEEANHDTFTKILHSDGYFKELECLASTGRGGDLLNLAGIQREIADVKGKASIPTFDDINTIAMDMAYCKIIALGLKQASKQYESFATSIIKTHEKQVKLDQKKKEKEDRLHARANLVAMTRGAPAGVATSDPMVLRSSGAANDVMRVVCVGPSDTPNQSTELPYIVAMPGGSSLVSLLLPSHQSVLSALIKKFDEEFGKTKLKSVATVVDAGDGTGTGVGDDASTSNFAEIIKTTLTSFMPMPSHSGPAALVDLTDALPAGNAVMQKLFGSTVMTGTRAGTMYEGVEPFGAASLRLCVCGGSGAQPGNDPIVIPHSLLLPL